MLSRVENNSRQSQSLLFLFLFSVFSGFSSSVFPEEIIVPSNHDHVDDAATVAAATAVAAQRRRQARWEENWGCIYDVLSCIGIVMLSLLLVCFLGYTVKTIYELIDNASAVPPCLSIGSFDPIAPLNLSSSTVTGSWNVSFGYSNGDHQKITYLDPINVTLYYQDPYSGDDNYIGNKVIQIHDVHQGKGQKWLNMSTRIDANSAPPPGNLLACTLYERDTNDKTITYAMAVETRAFVQPDRWFGETFHLSHYISGLDDENSLRFTHCSIC